MHGLLMTIFLLALSGDTDAPAQLEQRLIEAASVRFTYDIEATGAVTAAYRGHLVLVAGNQVDLEATGRFMDKTVAPRIHADGRRMHAGAGPGAVPEDLGEALILGFIRQGLLHNLAVTSLGHAPDGTDGGARTRFRLTLDGAVRAETVDGRKARALPFRLTVDGLPTAEGTLWLDAETHLPFLRRQVVHFPHGDMQVVETYSDFAVGQDPPPVVAPVPD